MSATLPGWVNEHQKLRLRRSPKNPLDVSTIISIYPHDITEKKQMEPEWYRIPKGNVENPGFLVVEGASSWREMMDTAQMIEIPISSVSVAESVIRDWVIGILEVNLGTRQPGLFFLPGRWDKISLFKNEDAVKVLKQYEEMQKKWFLALVDMGDSLWARSNGNPLAISDLMRIGANILGLKDKPWTRNFEAVRMVACIACGFHIMPGFPVCSNCKTVVDKVAFAKLGLAFAAPSNP